MSRGKGNKRRQVYAGGGVDLLLARSLELWGEGKTGDPLFLPVSFPHANVFQHSLQSGQIRVNTGDQGVPHGLLPTCDVPCIKISF